MGFVELGGILLGSGEGTTCWESPMPLNPEMRVPEGQRRATIQPQSSTGGLRVKISSLTSMLVSMESICITSRPLNSLLEIVRKGMRTPWISR